MSRHVVFGAGQVGRLLARRLVEGGIDVTTVSRHGTDVGAGARAVAGDAADPAFTTTVSAGADVVYFCLNPAGYGRWPEEFPPLQRAVLAGARAAGARLVVLENLYAYGPTGGRDLVETLPARPTSAKAAARAAMTAELLDAHRSGSVEIAVGRASDFFGPGTRQSALGDGVFGAALAGRTAHVLGRPDLAHSYSYTPDVAAALITLATRAEAAGSIWHLPVAQTGTTRQIVEQVYRLAGRRPRCVAAGATTLRLAGLVKAELREYRHTLYQFTQRWVVDDGRYRGVFGGQVTPLDDALAATLRWYRDAATPQSPTAGVDADRPLNPR